MMQHANQVYKVIKEKSNIRGYWKDEAGKLYRDNIKLVDYNRATVQELFHNEELAVLYTNSAHAVIENPDGSCITLRNNYTFHVEKINSKLFRKILESSNGFTVYKNKTFNDYTIEIWEE